MAKREKDEEGIRGLEIDWCRYLEKSHRKRGVKRFRENGFSEVR